MYGTVARMRVKPGQEQALIALSDEEDRTANMNRYVGMCVYRLDQGSNEYVLVVAFKDKESYHANANDPAQDQRYRQFRALLEADPEWNDGEIVYQSRSFGTRP